MRLRATELTNTYGKSIKYCSTLELRLKPSWGNEDCSKLNIYSQLLISVFFLNYNQFLVPELLYNTYVQSLWVTFAPMDFTWLNITASFACNMSKQSLSEVCDKMI